VADGAMRGRLAVAFTGATLSDRDGKYRCREVRI
jgi:hypothetical protein